MINLFSAFNIVVIARNLNPTLFNQHWLIINEFVTQEELSKGGSIFTDDTVQINADKFVLTVTQQQMIFVPKLLSDISSEIEVLKRIIEKIPETPFSAVGINFTYQILENEPSASSIFDYARKLFYNGELNLYKQHFSDASCNFGAYLSKNVEGVSDARLKLNILPINDMADDGPDKRLQLHFNYHLEYNISIDKAEKIVSFLSKYDTLDAECLIITESLNGVN